MLNYLTFFGDEVTMCVCVCVCASSYGYGIYTSLYFDVAARITMRTFNVRKAAPHRLYLRT